MYTFYFSDVDAELTGLAVPRGIWSPGLARQCHQSWPKPLRGQSLLSLLRPKLHFDWWWYHVMTVQCGPSISEVGVNSASAQAVEYGFVSRSENAVSHREQA